MRLQAFGATMALLLLATVPAPSVSAEELTVSGFLFSKLGMIGSKSEGPAYYLQKFDETEIKIKKHVPFFRDDPALRKHLGTKVTVKGQMEGSEFNYSSVEQCPPSVKGCEIQSYP